METKIKDQKTQLLTVSFPRNMTTYRSNVPWDDAKLQR